MAGVVFQNAAPARSPADASHGLAHSLALSSKCLAQSDKTGSAAWDD
jgi:hypothetical protein